MNDGAAVTREEFDKLRSDMELLRYRFEWLFVDGEVLLPELEVLKLTKSERVVLRLLATKPGRYISRELILQACYGREPDVDWPGDKIIVVFVSRLREKIKRTGWRIESQYGLGYRLLGKGQK